MTSTKKKPELDPVLAKIAARLEKEAENEAIARAHAEKFPRLEVPIRKLKTVRRDGSIRVTDTVHLNKKLRERLAIEVEVVGKARPPSIVCVDCGAVRKVAKASSRIPKRCKPCSIKAKREANREKIRARDKASREANREKYRAQEKARREANREKYRAQKKANYEANREKINAGVRARRAAQKKEKKT